MSDLLTPASLLEMMEGNRRLTLRVAEAFPEEKLFSFKPAEALRPFADMVKEFLDIEEAYVRGIATGEWVFDEEKRAGINTKQALLAECEAVRQRTRELWPKITAERLQAAEDDGFFGQGVQTNLSRLIYALENEIHHRGQGYIYLRILGIEPPPFYVR
ncbi:putative damage-inducible protein DinB [Symbiobacterium terraclitae]|uniref:Damage-inducible protein DinB n=1 Tax=Symbiobacterium terraclitae TaxID=557451 RepID=A0ABS4JMU7_9FIRM|nr:DinB family protein [Symbiobacterium terraclitae]MBP2016855.1 putative damage-inducible protein DinB [Symbiobacterium terraclitae]